MHRCLLYGVLLLATLFPSCTSDGVTAPALPEGLQGGNDPDFTDTCHKNMIAIASQCVIHYAIHGTYPVNLYDIHTILGSLKCPQCQSLYIYQGDQNGFSITCPLSSDPNHGCIRDGVASWAAP